MDEYDDDDDDDDEESNIKDAHNGEGRSEAGGQEQGGSSGKLALTDAEGASCKQKENVHPNRSGFTLTMPSASESSSDESSGDQEED